MLFCYSEKMCFMPTGGIGGGAPARGVAQRINRGRTNFADTCGGSFAVCKERFRKERLSCGNVPGVLYNTALPCGSATLFHKDEHTEQYRRLFCCLSGGFRV